MLSDGSAAASLRAHAYAYATWFYSGCEGVTSTGALQLPGPNTGAERLRALGEVLPSDWVERVSPREASDLAGIDIAENGLYFPNGAAIQGAALCRSLLDHPRIRFASDPPRGGIRVLANGCAIAESLPELEVAPLMGQVDRFDGGRLRLPVLADGYARPAGESCWVGATYEYRPWPTAEATAANAERFRKLFGRAPGASRGFFRGTRAVTSDRTPVIGRAGPDTCVSAGHGSVGVASAALAGEWIASLICGEYPPVSREIEALCRVDRFHERQRRRPNPFASGRRRER
ncbi:MAG: FAD-dependent oxidoreductase [Gammaproteobacteria bacterium]|nr:FAD-dependent oxidoreductase [Gammaproteobacteria bacterium]